MNRTVYAVIGLVVAFGLVALVLPWLLAGDRYTAEIDVRAQWGDGAAFQPAGCGSGAGAPRRFNGVFFILGGAHPRVMVPMKSDGTPRGLVLDTMPRPTRVEAAACSVLEGQIALMGREAHHGEGVKGQLKIECTLPDGVVLRLEGSFSNCFRPT